MRRVSSVAIVLALHACALGSVCACSPIARQGDWRGNSQLRFAEVIRLPSVAWYVNFCNAVQLASLKRCTASRTENLPGLTNNPATIHAKLRDQQQARKAPIQNCPDDYHSHPGRTGRRLVVAV